MDFEHQSSLQDGVEGPPQGGSISPRNAAHFVTERQRAVAERQKERPRYLCALLDESCPFMPKSGFDNCAKVKEDALRHMNSYQCKNCGKRFGKRYGLDRHRVKERKRPCTAGKFAEVSPELKALLKQLETAKGYQNLKEIMDQCRPHYDNVSTIEDGFQNRMHRGPSIQDLNSVEASGLTPVASQSTWVTLETIEPLFPQQRGVEVFPSGARGLGSSGVHHGDYSDATASSNHSCLPHAYYINNSPSHQAVEAHLDAGPSFINSHTSNERDLLPTQVSHSESPIHQRTFPVSFQGATTNNSETATSAANYPPGYNLGQQDIGHDRRIDTNSPPSQLQYREANNYFHALQISGRYFGDQQLVDETIDPSILEQTSGDNGTGSHQGMDTPNTFEGWSWEKRIYI